MNKIVLNKSLRKLANKGIRWRADYCKNYYYINISLTVGMYTDEYYQIDTDLYNAGNYFRTKEVAETVLNQIREMLYVYSSSERILGNPYYFIDRFFSADFLIELNDSFDTEMYNNGNYFRTMEGANIVSERIREILNNH